MRSVEIRLMTWVQGPIILGGAESILPGDLNPKTSIKIVVTGPDRPGYRFNNPAQPADVAGKGVHSGHFATAHLRNHPEEDLPTNVMSVEFGHDW